MNVFGKASKAGAWLGGFLQEIRQFLEILGDQRIPYEGERKRFRAEGDFLVRALIVMKVVRTEPKPAILNIPKPWTSRRLRKQISSYPHWKSALRNPDSLSSLLYSLLDDRDPLLRGFFGSPELEHRYLGPRWQELLLLFRWRLRQFLRPFIRLVKREE